MTKGGFTLPGESGYEKLTLELAERWGADVIRDSDGTKLSGELLDSGYDIYSTICPVREHNKWICENELTRQQTFLCTSPKTSIAAELEIRLLDDFFESQFQVNDTKAGMKYMQVYDRALNQEIPRKEWSYNEKTGIVSIKAKPFRQYTVSFLAWRIWEEISMYNHVTNKWDKEHLMQLNPYRPEALEYLKKELKRWCEENPHTNVVRFTSLFYNFAWIWGAGERNRYLFTDWASYDFTVCPEALDDFADEYGYALCAEDFVRGGKYFSTHCVPNAKKIDWMEFIGRFVRLAGKELVDVVHSSGKLAYVFYDDNWVGIEPYNGHFEEFGFNGLVKCVFSGYEVRLCAGVPVKTHEIRFHPYLFPVGLGGAPTFSPGGKPGEDALGYWVNVRRALLRDKIQRCGLGGYLHLVKDYPDFIEAMDSILSEFREISALHDKGTPLTLKPRVAILHAWGKLRAWTLSGHFHETSGHSLIHVLESLSGLPFDVEFISFKDITGGIPENIDVIINAGASGDAWSGGACWNDYRIVEILTAWINGGGTFIGIGEPSALKGINRYLRMAHALGVDIDNGEYTCHGKWTYDIIEEPGLVPDGVCITGRSGVMLTDGLARVLVEAGGSPAVTEYAFGSGKGIYCSNFKHSAINTRFLQNLILYSSQKNMIPEGISGDPLTECAIYPDAGRIAMINNSDIKRTATVSFKGTEYEAVLEPFELKIINI